MDLEDNQYWLGHKGSSPYSTICVRHIEMVGNSMVSYKILGEELLESHNVFVYEFLDTVRATGSKIIPEEQAKMLIHLWRGSDPQT